MCTCWAYNNRKVLTISWSARNTGKWQERWAAERWYQPECRGRSRCHPGCRLPRRLKRSNKNFLISPGCEFAQGRQQNQGWWIQTVLSKKSEIFLMFCKFGSRTRTEPWNLWVGTPTKCPVHAWSWVLGLGQTLNFSKIYFLVGAQSSRLFGVLSRANKFHSHAVQLVWLELGSHQRHSSSGFFIPDETHLPSMTHWPLWKGRNTRIYFAVNVLWNEFTQRIAIICYSKGFLSLKINWNPFTDTTETSWGVSNQILKRNLQDVEKVFDNNEGFLIKCFTQGENSCTWAEHVASKLSVTAHLWQSESYGTKRALSVDGVTPSLETRT